MILDVRGRLQKESEVPDKAILSKLLKAPSQNTEVWTIWQRNNQQPEFCLEVLLEMYLNKPYLVRCLTDERWCCALLFLKIVLSCARIVISAVGKGYDVTGITYPRRETW